MMWGGSLERFRFAKASGLYWFTVVALVGRALRDLSRAERYNDPTPIVAVRASIGTEDSTM